MDASNHRCPSRLKEILTILPIINKEVHRLNTQFHCMKIIKDTINGVNPGQTPVDLCDQPIYALTKQIQWRIPEEFREYFSLFGLLHIEKSLLLVHNDFIKRSGLPEVLGVCNLSVSRLENTMVYVSDIKNVRCALQVSACAIHQKLTDTHTTSGLLCLFGICLKENRNTVL